MFGSADNTFCPIGFATVFAAGRAFSIAPVIPVAAPILFARAYSAAVPASFPNPYENGF